MKSMHFVLPTILLKTYVSHISYFYNMSSLDLVKELISFIPKESSSESKTGESQEENRRQEARRVLHLWTSTSIYSFSFLQDSLARLFPSTLSLLSNYTHKTELVSLITKVHREILYDTTDASEVPTLPPCGEPELPEFALDRVTMEPLQNCIMLKSTETNVIGSTVNFSTFSQLTNGSTSRSGTDPFTRRPFVRGKWNRVASDATSWLMKMAGYKLPIWPLRRLRHGEVGIGVGVPVIVDHVTIPHTAILCTDGRLRHAETGLLYVVSSVLVEDVSPEDADPSLATSALLVPVTCFGQDRFMAMPVEEAIAFVSSKPISSVIIDSSVVDLPEYVSLLKVHPSTFSTTPVGQPSTWGNVSVRRVIPVVVSEQHSSGVDSSRSSITCDRPLKRPRAAVPVRSSPSPLLTSSPLLWRYPETALSYCRANSIWSTPVIVPHQNRTLIPMQIYASGPALFYDLNRGCAGIKRRWKTQLTDAQRKLCCELASRSRMRHYPR